MRRSGVWVRAATGGATSQRVDLGGSTLDQRLLDHLLDVSRLSSYQLSLLRALSVPSVEYTHSQNFPCRSGYPHEARSGAGRRAESIQDLRRECELAKRKLSNRAELPVNLFFPRVNLRYQSSISRARFEGLCVDLFRKVLDLTTSVLAEANVSTVPSSMCLSLLF